MHGELIPRNSGRERELKDGKWCLAPRLPEELDQAVQENAGRVNTRLSILQ